MAPGRLRRCYWWRVLWTPWRDSPPAHAGFQILGKVEVVDVPVFMLHTFHQSKYERVKVPLIQFLDRVLDTAGMPQSGMHSVKLGTRP